jgi:hypothetical protein
MFKYILAFTAFSLAGCAAFFSIKGIALLFSGSFWSVAVMASVLEIGKVISTAYLYKYWNEINSILKKYMIIASTILMIITSLGIFGFLSDAFQKNFSQYNLNVEKINSFKNQQVFFTSQIEFNKSKLKDLIELQKTYQTSLDAAAKQDVTTTKTTGGGLFSGQKTEKVTDAKLLDSRNKIIEGSQQNIKNLFDQIQIVTTELSNLETKASQTTQEIIMLEADNTKGEVGTFKFVAEAFGLKIETAAKLFIILIVIVFDPLAISLILAYNAIILQSTKITDEQIRKETPIEKIVNVIKYQTYKRGTKKNHNPDLADPYLKSNQDVKL